MKTKITKSYMFYHCFKRKDWNYNRKMQKLTTGTKERERLLCAGCRYSYPCLRPVKITITLLKG